MVSIVRQLRNLDSGGTLGFSIPKELNEILKVGETYQITINEIKPEVKNP